MSKLSDQSLKRFALIAWLTLYPAIGFANEIFPEHEHFGFNADSTSSFNDLSARYTWTPRFAFGLLHTRLRRELTQRTISGTQVYFLVKKVESSEGDPRYEGAVVLIPGFAYDRKSSVGSMLFTADLDAYWKNNFAFFEGRFGLGAFSSQGAYHHFDLKLLVAPYQASTQELASHIGPQVIQNSFVSNQAEVFLALRQSYRNVSWRIGASMRGFWLLGLGLELSI